MENIEEKIIWFYNEGLTITEVANRLDSTERIVSRILHNNNVKIRSKNKCTLEEEKEIIARYKAGEKVALIAKEKNISISVVYGIFKRNNIKVDPPSKQHRLYKYNEHYFDIIDTQEKAYILGLIYADGTLVENCISIFLQEEDGEVLEKIKECFESEIPIKFVPYNDGRRKNQKKFSITNEHLARTLEGLGVIHNKTFTLKYPNFLTEELTPHFIRGYFDGDGCVWFTKDKNRKVYQHCFGIAGTLDICEHISKILEEKCDAKLHIRKRFKDKDESYTIRQAECGGNLKIKRIFNYLYKDATIYMNRKYQRFVRNTP